MVIRLNNSWNMNSGIKGSSKNGGIRRFFGGKKTTDEKNEGQETIAAMIGDLDVSGEIATVFEGSPEDLESFFKLCQQDNVLSWDLLKKMGREFCAGLKSAIMKFNMEGEAALGSFGETVQNIITRWCKHGNETECEQHKSSVERALKIEEIDLEAYKTRKSRDLDRRETDFEARKAERELEKKFSKEKD